MTELTQEQRETLERAKAREGKTTPAPWEWGGEEDEHQVILADPYTVVVAIEWTDFGHQIAMPNQPDQDLLVDAPNLDALALAQATITDDLVIEAHHRQSQLDDERNENGILRERLEKQTARIVALERKLGYLEAHTIYRDAP